MRITPILLLAIYFSFAYAEDKSLWVVPKVLQPGEISEEHYLVEADDGKYFIFYIGHLAVGTINDSGCPSRVAFYDNENKLRAFYSGTIRISGVKVSLTPDSRTPWGPHAKDFVPDSFSWKWSDPKQPRSVLIFDGYDQSNGKLRASRVQEEPIFSSLLRGHQPPEKID
jgi:hypothetical protein